MGRGAIVAAARRLLEATVTPSRCVRIPDHAGFTRAADGTAYVDAVVVVPAEMLREAEHEPWPHDDGGEG